MLRLEYLFIYLVSGMLLNMVILDNYHYISCHIMYDFLNIEILNIICFLKK